MVDCLITNVLTSYLIVVEEAEPESDNQSQVAVAARVGRGGSNFSRRRRASFAWNPKNLNLGFALDWSETKDCLHSKAQGQTCSQSLIDRMGSSGRHKRRMIHTTHPRLEIFTLQPHQSVAERSPTWISVGRFASRHLKISIRRRGSQKVVSKFVIVAILLSNFHDIASTISLMLL